MRIGVDAGGTFTDFIVLHEDGRLETFKLRSNPAAPAQVILAGLKQALQDSPKSLRKGTIDVVHGSTVATNALLERKGARTAFVTTKGFEDLLEIGRQNRPELYNLTPLPRPNLIDRKLCFGVAERAYHDGTIAQRPSDRELQRLAARIQRSGAASVAICFLHSYRSPVNERAVATALKSAMKMALKKAVPSQLFICASHEISPEFREYERASTTAVNAYVGPLMDAYLSDLEAQLKAARGFRLAIMQSNGGFLDARDARKHAVRTVLSGPAGGVVGAAQMARHSGFDKILGFDMGGTSTDVSISDRAPQETTEATFDGSPIRVPMLDIHTVGAGGGSIARVDAGGLLHVGPESAGADPGPACYGKGTEATVTDAHVVLGRIDALLGGGLAIDTGRSAAAVDGVAGRLGIGREEAAAGIVRVANANMERAIRVVSVERGHDPREFALVAFGGCGGLHACEIAAELGIATVLVPEHAGVLSALGMLLADATRDYAAGVLGTPIDRDVDAAFAKLERKAQRESSGPSGQPIKLERSADLRYRGQSYEINIPWTASPARTIESFHRQHAAVYGYSRPDQPVEVVTIRVRARTRVPKPRFRSPPKAAGNPPASTRRIWTAGAWHPTPVLTRDATPAQAKPLSGPALVLDYGSTTLIPPDWRFHADRSRTLVIRRKSQK